MNNTRMLPSISNLLISSSPSSYATTTKKKSDPPPIIVNLSPASPVLSLPSTPPHHTTKKSPTRSYLSLDNNRITRYSSISPILSPIDSPSNNNNVQYLSLMNNHLPPLQGDDPPQRLRLPSPSSPITPKSLLFSSNNNNNTNTTIWNNSNNIGNHYSLSPSCSSTSSSSTTVSFEDASCASIESSPSLPTLEHFSVPLPPPQPRRSTNSSNTTVSPIPNTQIVFDSSGQPVLKRRRGRPPTCINNFENGGWTFLTPTVWNIHISEEQKERELKADNNLLLKTQQQQQEIHHEQVHVLDDNVMNDSMNAFTNSNMDTILQMPRKKRGRKPKTHIAGNSCFVWKDLTSTRSVSVKK